MSFRLWLLLHIVIGFPLGIVVANFGEWAIHKHILHNRGKRKGNFFNFHFYDHHAEARKHDMIDASYQKGWVGGGWNPRTKEATSLILSTLPWFALAPWIPGFSAGLIFSAGLYYFVHKKAHLDPAWARKYLPWHVDHHMGADQDQNWCVTFPWADIVLGTRVKYVGTEAESASKAAKAARRSAGEPAEAAL